MTLARKSLLGTGTGLPRSLQVLAIVLVLAAGCTSTEGPVVRDQRTTTAPDDRALPKRIVAAMMSTPSSPVAALARPGSTPGIEVLEELTNAGLVQFDDQGGLRAQIAEAVPTFENGLWRLLPDGRTSTTWAFRPGAAWHDGTRVSVNDVRFTLQVGRDPDLPQFRDPAYALIDSIEANDTRTFTVVWKQPYLKADLLFSRQPGGARYLLPQHRLGSVYQESRADFLADAYWTGQFTGTGPYWLQRWEPGQGAIFEAFDGYFFGPPVIDLIEVRFVPDANRIGTALVGGLVDVTFGRTLSYAAANQVREQWRAGRQLAVLAGPVQVTPLQSPQQSDARLRQALLLALDRQEIGDRFVADAVVAQTFVVPGQSEYASSAGAATPYPVDLDRARRLLDDLGFGRTADGRWVSSSGADAMRVGLAIDAEPNNTLASLLETGWAQLGFATCSLGTADCTAGASDVVPLALGRGVVDLRDLGRLVPGAQVSIGGGRRAARFSSGALGDLVDRYHHSLPSTDRTDALRAVVRQVSDEVALLPLHYDVRVALVAQRITNVSVAPSSTLAWNVDRWDVR